MIERLRSYNVRERWSSLDPKRVKRSVFYPLIYASIGVVAAEIAYETVYATEVLGFAALRYAITKEPIDFSVYFNNPFRNMYFSEFPLFVGKVMTLVGALKAFAEESLGREPDYKALFNGRPG